MRRHFRIARLLVPLFVSGCAVLTPTEQVLEQVIGAPITPPASVQEAISTAQGMARDGRWSEAIRQLQQAQAYFPQERELVDEQRVLEQLWVYERRAIEDELMVGDTENQQHKIRLLERLVRAEPQDLVLASRRMYWKEILDGKAERLTECAEHHMEARPSLAKRCYEQALILGGRADLQARLATVDTQLRADKKQEAKRVRMRRVKERQARVKALLNEAKAAIDAHDYRQALDTIAEVEALQPDNTEAGGLKQEAWSMITPQIKALIKLGDHLYLDEQLEAAVATWQAALTLKPGDEELQARIERAQAVLDRLDSLREKQQVGTEGGKTVEDAALPPE